MAQLRQTNLTVYNCPSDLNRQEVLIPASGPGGENGYPIPLFRTSNYRANAGTTFGGVAGFTNPNGTSLDSGGDRNWDDAWNGQAAWLYTNKSEWRGPIYGVDKRTGMNPARIADVTDGTSNTLLIGEYATKTQHRRRSFWAYAYSSYNLSCITIGQTRTLLADFDKCDLTPPRTNGNNQCKRGWGSFHPSGILNFAMTDGSVRTVSINIEVNTVLPALGSIGGGESAPANF
jgi:Protein of unknown function (DUF1559)